MDYRHVKVVKVRHTMKLGEREDVKYKDVGVT